MQRDLVGSVTIDNIGITYIEIKIKIAERDLVAFNTLYSLLRDTI